MLHTDPIPTARNTRFKPAGTVVSKNVQAAIEELDSDIQGMSGGTGAVRYDVNQSLSSGEAARARNNIGAVAVSALSELVDDRVAALLVAGSGISLVYNDALNTLTITATGGGGGGGLTEEEIEDLLAADFLPGWDTEIEYDDAAGTFAWHRYSRRHTITDGATITIDLDRDNGRLQDVTIDGDRDVEVVNAVAGKHFEVRITQGAGGNHDLTYLFPVTWIEAGVQPKLTPVEGDSDLIHFYIESVDGYGVPTCRAWVETTERPLPLVGSAQIAASATVETTTEGAAGETVNSIVMLFRSATDETFEKQRLFGDAGVSDGTFTITIDGETTAAIPFDCSPIDLVDAVNSALNTASKPYWCYAYGAALSRLVDGDSFWVVFVPTAGNDPSNLGLLSIDSSGLTGGAYTSAALHDGSGTTTPASGTYQLLVQRNGDSELTAPIDADATAVEVLAILENVTLIGTFSVSISVVNYTDGTFADGFRIEFVGDCAGDDVYLSVPTNPLDTGAVETHMQQIGGTAGGTNEKHTLTMFDSPTTGSVVLTILGEDVVIPVDATAGEAEALIEAAIGGNPLSEPLAYWMCQESSGDRLDEMHAIPIQGTGMSRVSGLNDWGVEIDNFNQTPYSALLHFVPNGSYTFAAAFRNEGNVIWGNGATNYEVRITRIAVDEAYATVVIGGVSYSVGVGSLVEDQWHYIALRIDAINETLGISLDGGTFTDVAMADTFPEFSTWIIYLQRAAMVNSKIDEIGLWDFAFTDADALAMWTALGADGFGSLGGADSVIVTGGPLPDSAIVIEFTGPYAETNVAASSVDDSGLGGAAHVVWSECDYSTVTLSPGDGEYSIRHVKLIPGKVIRVEVISDGATGTINWDGGDAAVTWPAGEPAMPADGDSLFVEFQCLSLTRIIGKVWSAAPGEVTQLEEVPVGDIDGVNDTFTLSQSPASNSLFLFVNGLVQRRAADRDYTLSGAVITFNAGSIPPSGSEVFANYRT